VEDAKPAVIIRIGSHSEKEYIEKLGDHFDGLMIGANLVEVTPGASASLLIKVAGETKKTPYYFDPMTYAFGSYIDPQTGYVRADLDWIKSDQKVKGGKKGQVARLFKSSYAKLANALGPPFSTAVDNSTAITSGDFNTKAKLKAVAQSVVRYQRERIKGVFRDDEEYKDYADEVPEPAVVFAPYFYVEPSDAKGWIDTNLRLARATAELGDPSVLHMILCAPKELLTDQQTLKQLESDLPETGVTGVWLWFSRFDEQSANYEELSGLRRMVTKLSGAGLKVYNLHGGYFSLALSKFGLTGVAHGVGYGEQKDVVPIIGQSTPTVRYYVPPLHGRFGVPNIVLCFNALGITSPAAFWDQICDCAICKGIVGKGLDRFASFGEMHLSTPTSKRLAQTPAAAKLCRFHFLLSRLRERDAIEKMDADAIREQLRSAREEWNGTNMQSSLSHIGLWRSALRIDE
jgi:hypothetical protein